jgi:hypothetical protein
MKDDELREQEINKLGKHVDSRSMVHGKPDRVEDQGAPAVSSQKGKVGRHSQSETGQHSSLRLREPNTQAGKLSSETVKAAVAVKGFATLIGGRASVEAYRGNSGTRICVTADVGVGAGLGGSVSIGAGVDVALPASGWSGRAAITSEASVRVGTELGLSVEHDIFAETTDTTIQTPVGNYSLESDTVEFSSDTGQLGTGLARGISGKSLGANAEVAVWGGAGWCTDWIRNR